MATTKNKLRLIRVTCNPSSIPAPGGGVELHIELVTTSSNATATATCRVAAGFPYTITKGATKTHSVTTSAKPFTQPITLKKGSGSVGMILINVDASIPGDAVQKGSCTVLVKDVLAMTVKAFREQKGLTQSALAERLGISRSPISRIERGEGASSSVAEQIMELLK